MQEQEHSPPHFWLLSLLGLWSLPETLPYIIMNASQLLQHAHEIVSNCTLCFVSSNDASGQINSRVVEILEIGNDLTIRFMTDSRTRKALEIHAGKMVSLSFLSMTDRGYVTIGTLPTVSAETALKQRIWKESLRTWFPNGPDDPHVITVTCEPTWVELWSRMRGIAPAPLGLNSVRLTRSDNDWKAHQTFPTDGEPLRL
ncbi:pyridoxamine 5'-phosphate oxidase family protein [Ralstonia sp. 24A2]|uniref:pyridoxamine 5'-phosphate oxidase family protein n=1 Tax=Ralstonia sp. 24A2 TaxID=3447364 RepID=UPI003F6985B8